VGAEEEEEGEAEARTSRRKRPPDRNARAAAAWSGVERAHVEGGDCQPVEAGRGEPRVGDEVAVGGAEGDGGDGEERGEREQQRAEATVAAHPPHGSSALWVAGRRRGQRRTRGKFLRVASSGFGKKKNRRFKNRKGGETNYRKRAFWVSCACVLSELRNCGKLCALQNVGFSLG
jgi:hypothetical protein